MLKLKAMKKTPPQGKEGGISATPAVAGQRISAIFAPSMILLMENVKRNSPKAWLLAARPKTLTAAAIPVIAGTAAAYADGHFRWQPAAACLVFALLMQVAANFINDLFDYLNGSDRSDRLGPKRACAEGWITPRAMMAGVAATVAAACTAGCFLLPYGGWPLVVVGAVCVVFAFSYTTGPYPLSYHGWGDLMVLVFFGLVPVGCTYYVQAGAVTPQVVAIAAACGLAIDTLLVVNNYRDRETDARSGKRTVVVRWGEPFGRYLYLGLGVAATLLCLSCLAGGKPLAALLPQLYLVPHVLTGRKMARLRQGRALNAVLGATSRNILFFALLLAAGLALSAA